MRKLGLLICLAMPLTSFQDEQKFHNITTEAQLKSLQFQIIQLTDIAAAHFEMIGQLEKRVKLLEKFEGFRPGINQRGRNQ